MYSFPSPLSSFARVLFLSVIKQGKARQEKCQSLFFFFFFLVLIIVVNCNANRKLYFLSLSLLDNCTRSKKKKNVGTLEIAKGSKRSFLLCKWILGNRSKCQFQIVSRRSKARQGGCAFRIESVFFFFFQFSIRFSFHPSSLQSRRMNVCTRDVRNYEGLRVHFLWIYEKF